jgi:hypothetical protein
MVIPPIFGTPSFGSYFFPRAFRLGDTGRILQLAEASEEGQSPRSAVEPMMMMMMMI